MAFMKLKYFKEIGNDGANVTHLDVNYIPLPANHQ